MSDLNLPPFYVGQRIAVIKDMDAGTGGFKCKNGDEFTVVAMHFCCQWRVDIGATYHKGTIRCMKCLDLYKNAAILFPSKLFVPVTENFQSISLENVMEKETPLISVN